MHIGMLLRSCVLMMLATSLAVAGPSKKPPPPPPPPAPAPAPAPAPPKNPSRADKLFEDGRRYLASKEYALACTAFEQSQQAESAVGTQLNIALCYEEWGKLATAYRAYVEAERLAKADRDKERARGARDKQDQLSPKIARVIATIPATTVAGTTFALDGTPLSRTDLEQPIMVDAGDHTIEARLTNRPTTQTAVSIRNGERKTVTLVVPQPETKTISGRGPRKTGKLIGGIALVTIGAGALGGAAIVSYKARTDYADAIGDCPDRRCETRSAFDATEKARSRANLMTFVGAGGVALAGVGVWLVITSKGERFEKVVPVVTNDHVGLAVGGRW